MANWRVTGDWDKDSKAQEDEKKKEKKKKERAVRLNERATGDWGHDTAVAEAQSRQAAKSSTWWEDYKRSQRYEIANRQLEKNRSRDAAEDEIRELWRNPFLSDTEWQAGVLQRNADRYKRDLQLYQEAMQNAPTWGEYFSARRQAGESQSAVKNQFERYQQAAQKAEQERNESNLINRPAQWQAENLTPQEIEQRLAYYRSEAATPTVTDKDREERAYLYPEAALQKDPHGARFDERLVEDAGQDAIDAAYRPILTEQEKAAVEEADQQIIKEKAERNYEQVQRLLAAQAGQTEAVSRARGNELIEEIAQGGEAADRAKTGKALFEQQQKKIDEESPTIIYGAHGNYSSAMAERTKRGYILGSDWDNVPEDRKQAVYALYTESPEKAIELAKYYIADEQNAEDEERQAWYAQSGWTAALGLASSAAAHLGAAVDPFGPVGQELTRYGDSALAGGSQWADAATNYQKIPEWVPIVGGKGAGDFYQTVGSVVQSAAVAAPAILAGRYDTAAAETIGKLGLALMGSSAAASDYRESVAAGMDEDRAKLHALAAGVEEALFEEVSLDKLIKMDTSGGLKAALKNWLVQSGIEGSEELATSIANRITDEMISGAGQSKVERRASELIANGMNSTQAHTQAENEWMTDTLYEGFSGFLSGGMMTGGNYALQGAANLTERAVNAVETRKAQRQAGAAVSRSEGSVEALQAYAKDKGIEIKDVETAEQNAEQGGQGAKQNNYSNRDYRSISDTNSKVVQSIRSDLRGKTVQEQQAVRDSLVEKYGEGIAPAVYNAISIETASRVRQEYGDVDSIQAARNQAVSEIKDESLRRAVSDGYDSAAYSIAASQGSENGMNTMSRYIQQRRNTGSGSEMSMNATVTAQDGSTKTVAITGMSEDGKRVSLADGSEVAVKDLQADADTTSAIQQLADLDLGADATKVLQAYQQSGVAGTEGYRWLMDYATAYNQGRTRQISLEQAAQRSSLDERTVMDAYTLGQQAANRETLAGLEKLKNLPKRKGASGRTANIDTTEIKGKTMSKSELEQFELANQYAQALGVDMKWFSSEEQDGKFVDKNGAYENGKIYMDIHAGRNFAADLTSGILATMGHELSHFEQQYAPEEYQALKEFLFEQIVKSSPNGEARLERLIWEKQRRSGYTLSRKAAEDEVVADACQKMLRDSKAVHDFANQQPEAANGVVRWLDKWFKRVRSIFGRGGNYSEEAKIMDSLEQDVKAAFGELWDKALKQAVQVHDEVGNIEKATTKGESTAQNSDRDAEYLELAEDPEENAARLQEMVDEAAKRAGFTSPMLFHGTNAFGFTTIKTSKDVHADGFSFWAANKESAAGTYTRYGKTREIESEIDYEETEEAIEERSADVDEAIDDFRYLIDRTFSEWFYGQQGNEVIRRGVDDSNPVPGSGDGVYDFLVDQVADAFNEYSDSLSETYEDFADFQERSKEWEKIEDAIVAIEGAYSALSEIQSEGLVGGIYELYANTDNMYVVDAKGAAWNALHPEGLPKIERGEYKNIPYKTRDVANWARDNGYDGVIFKNIKDNGAYGRTESFDVYAFFNPQAQVKSADPVTYDDQGNVIPLSERFNTKNEDIRFSMREPVEQTDRLIAWHNMNEDALRSALELGGLAMPSWAIKTADRAHTSYGSISVIAPRSLVDPKTNRSSMIFGGDAWTPVFPDVDYDISYDAVEKLHDEITGLIGQNVMRELGGAALDTENIARQLKNAGGKVSNYYKKNVALRYAYLKSIGENINVPRQEIRLDKSGQYDNKAVELFADRLTQGKRSLDYYRSMPSNEVMQQEDLKKAITDVMVARFGEEARDFYAPDELSFRNIEAMLSAANLFYKYNTTIPSETDKYALAKEIDKVIDEEAYEKWIGEKLNKTIEKKGIRNEKDPFAPSGKRRSFDALHYAYNLANIVKAMKAQPKQGRTQFLSGPGSVKGAALKSYNTVEQVREDRGRLVNSAEEGQKAYDEYNRNLEDILDRMRKNGDRFDAADALIEVFQHAKTESGIYNYMQRELKDWYNISRELAHDAYELIGQINRLPMEYFEGKTYDAVPFDETAAVVVPDNIDPALKQQLNDAGARVVEYKAGDDSDRLAKVNSVEGAQFSERDYSTPSDEELLMNARVEDAESAEARAALQNSQKQARQIRDLTRRLEHLQTEIRGYEGDSPNRISVQRFTRQALDLFGIPSGMRTDMGELLQSVAEGVLAGHNLSQNDIMYFFETLITNGREKTVADETLAEIRNDLKGRKIYVNENVKAEFGDDWNAFRKRAFSLGIQLTNNEKNMGIDSVNAELAELYPGKFDANETDLRSILENMVDTAESGKTSDVPILDAMREIQKQTGEPVREQLQTMLDQFTRQIEIMQDQAAVERKARAGNAAEIAKARKQINEAKEALREVRKQRDAWKRKSEGADARQKRAFDAALRGVVQHDAKQIAEAVRQKQALAKKLQDQIDREKKILSGELRSPELVKLLKAEREKAEARVKEQKEEQFARYKDRKHQTEIRNRIKNLYAEMNRDLLKPRDGHYVPESLIRPVVELLDMVNTQTNRTKSEAAQAKIDAINRAYDKIKSDERYSQYYDETVKGMLVELSETLEGRSIYDMNTDELSDLYTVMKAMRTTIRNSIRADLIEKGKQIWEIGDALRRELRNGKGASRYLLEKYHMSMLSAERAFHRFGGYRQGSTWDKVYRMLDDAQLKMLDLEMQATRIFDPVLKAKADFALAEKLTSIKEKDLVDVGLRDADGNAVKLTRGMMLSLYMHLQNEENMRHLMYGGMTLPDYKKYYNGNSEAWGRGTVEIPALGAKVANLDALLDEIGEQGVDEKYAEYKAEIEEMFESVRQNIEDKLTEYDRKWIAASKQFFDGFSRQELNKVTNEMYGFSKAKVDNYFPIVTDPNFLKSEFDAISRNISLENAGFMKERVKAGNPILLEDITRTVNRQISNVSRYAGLTQALKQFGNVYNVQTKGFTDSVKKAMAKSYGKNGQEYIQNLITDMIGGRSTPGSIFDRIKGNYAQAVLSANLSVTIKQAASFPTAAATVGWKPILKALAKGGRNNRLISRANRELIDTYSPLLWKRSQGAIDTEIGDMAHARDWTKKAKWLMGWIEKTDIATVGRLWSAAEYYVENNFKGLQKGTTAQIQNGESEFYRKVAEVFNAIVEDTQPNYTVLQRPDILRNPNKLVRAMTMFSTQRFQNANIMIDAVNEYAAMVRYDKKSGTAETKAARKAAKTKLTNAISSQVVSAVVLNAMTLVASLIMHRMNPWRDDDDELTQESIMEEMMNGFISSMAGSFLGGSELYEAVHALLTGSKYYGNDVGGISTINEFATAVVQFGQQAVKLIGDENSKPEDWQKLAEKQLTKVGEYLTQMTGVPAANINKIIAGGKNHVIDAINGEFGSFEAGVDRTTAVNARRYLKAYLDEDTEKAATVMKELRKNLAESGKDEGKINEAIRKYVSAQAVEKVADGTWTEEEAEAYLLSTGAYDDRENPQKDAWNAIRKGVAKSTSTDEEYSWKQYDELAEAVANGEDVTGLLAEYRNHGYSDDQINAAIRSGIQEAMTAGDLDGNEAADALIRYGVTYSKDGKTVAYDEQTAWKKVQEWIDKAEHTDEEGELEDGYKYSAYSDLFEAVDANQNAEGIIQTMVQNGGYDTDGLRGQIKDHLSERFIAGEITETALKNQLARYCKITKTEDANEIVKSAKCKRDFGVSPDGLKEAFKDGDLSQNQAEKALQQYKGLSKTDAQNRVQYWGYDGDLSENAWLKWNNELKGSGLSVNNWEKVYEVKSSAKGTDANGDGRADSGTVKAEVVAYIDSMNIPKSQKKAIYLAFGWAASTMPNWR